MAPTYEELGRKFVGHDKVKIAKVDCTQEVNRGLCSQQKVRNFLLHLFSIVYLLGICVFVLYIFLLPFLFDFEFYAVMLLVKFCVLKTPLNSFSFH